MTTNDAYRLFETTITAGDVYTDLYGDQITITPAADGRATPPIRAVEIDAPDDGDLCGPLRFSTTEARRIAHALMLAADDAEAGELAGKKALQ